MSEVVGAGFTAPAVADGLAQAPAGVLAMALMPNESLLSNNTRPVFALDADPLRLLALVVQMNGPPPEVVSRVFTRLFDTPYRGRPWGRVIESLYHVTCPACWRQTRAEYFRWRGLPPALQSRFVHCEHCGYSGEAAAEDEERAFAAEIMPSPAQVWEMTGRVLPPEHGLRTKVEHAHQFYTTRNLWVLWETLRILAELELSAPERRALQWIVARALWWGSNLAQQPALLWQPHLRRPRQFLEPNMHIVFEKALQEVRDCSGRLPRTQVTQVAPLLEGEKGRILLTQRWPISLKTGPSARPLALVLLSVPPPTPLYWLLRFVWSGWLFGQRAARPLLPLLELRQTTTAALPEGFEEMVAWLEDALHEEGVLVVQWRWRGVPTQTAALLAALPPVSAPPLVARVDEHEWLGMVSCRPQPSAAEQVISENRLVVGAEAMRQTLRERGEPLLYPPLQAAVLAAWQSHRLLEADDLSLLQRLFDPQTPPQGITAINNAGEPATSEKDVWWWLEIPPDPWQPASDSAERKLVELLAEQPPNKQTLLQTLTQALSPAAIPDRPWFEALLNSYAVSEDGRIHLRKKDEPAARHEEIMAFAEMLMERGRDFGFDTVHWWEEKTRLLVEWYREKQRRLSFLLSANTNLTPRLWLSRTPLPPVQRYLVLPGGRAGLVRWRIEHQPLWATIASAQGWSFVKFRQLRTSLSQPPSDLELWLNTLQFDPLFSEPGEQLQLW
ncbi:MAG: hypothetical protein GXP38_03900 [Chloroflexi bacterium]|nr:hypothetical protein [Chloroflexota bacterium]